MLLSILYIDGSAHFSFVLLINIVHNNNWVFEWMNILNKIKCQQSEPEQNQHGIHKTVNYTNTVQ